MKPKIGRMLFPIVGVFIKGIPDFALLNDLIPFNTRKDAGEQQDRWQKNREEQCGEGGHREA